MSVPQVLKKFVPKGIVDAFANCGGTNLRSERFAANLLRDDLSDDQFLGIMHSLIFPNGVRKTTARGRNTAVLRKLLDEGALALPRRPLRVLDIGASGGLDALATHALLSSVGRVESYMLGDLHTRVLYDRDRGLVYDEDGDLVQVRRRVGFVATHFEYSFRYQRLMNLPKRVRPWLLRRRFSAPADGAALVPIPLVHRSLRVGSPGSPFRLARMNVFQAIPGEYDLVICMHLLVDRYFSRERIEEGVRNLSHALAPGGSLLVGATEKHRLVVREPSGGMVEHAFGG